MNSLVAAELPTKHGLFEVRAFPGENAAQPHLLLLSKSPLGGRVPLVRIHSECWTGDVMGSLRCDCGEQLRLSSERIAAEGGAILYLRQEGRGIGLVDKLKAYNLQDEGMDTFEANHALGHASDARSYDLAVGMLDALGWKRVRLITNNPEKRDALQQAGIAVDEVVSLEIARTPHSENYLRAKERVAGHGRLDGGLDA